MSVPCDLEESRRPPARKATIRFDGSYAKSRAGDAVWAWRQGCDRVDPEKRQ